MTYSYDPTLIGENGPDRMRFELGDTTFAPGELTAALCDEEYSALIDANTGKSWNYIKIKCLRAILMKFAHQVDMKVDTVSYSFSERIDFWKKLLDELESEEASSAPPLMAPSALNRKKYFYGDMQANNRKRGGVL